MSCNFFPFQKEPKLQQTRSMQDCQKQNKTQDSPLQIQLINFLGLRSFLIDALVFKRKAPKYQICTKEGKQCLLTPHLYQPPQGFEVKIKIIEKNKHSVPVLVLSPTDYKPKHTIIYSHGNASDMSDSLWFMQRISRSIKAEFVVYDYSGYGASRVRQVGEQIICADLQMVISWLNKPMNQIILWGFSLGTFPVIYNAAKHAVKGIILQSPIASVCSIFQKQLNKNTYFKEDYLANLKYFDKIRGKIFMAHSSADQIIPFSHSKLLYDKFVCKNGDQRITFIEVGKIKHNQMNCYIASDRHNSLKRQMFEFINEIMEYQSKHDNDQIPMDLQKIKMQLTYAPLQQHEFNEDEYQIVTNQDGYYSHGNIVGDFKGCLCMKK